MMAINVDITAGAITECCPWKWKVLLGLLGWMRVRVKMVILGTVMTTRDEWLLLLVVLLIVLRPLG